MRHHTDRTSFLIRPAYGQRIKQWSHSQIANGPFPLSALRPVVMNKNIQHICNMTFVTKTWIPLRTFCLILMKGSLRLYFHYMWSKSEGEVKSFWWISADSTVRGLPSLFVPRLIQSCPEVSWRRQSNDSRRIETDWYLDRRNTKPCFQLWFFAKSPRFDRPFWPAWVWSTKVPGAANC